MLVLVFAMVIIIKFTITQLFTLHNSVSGQSLYVVIISHDPED